jgi:hypothetical protein
MIYQERKTVLKNFTINIIIKLNFIKFDDVI